MAAPPAALPPDLAPASAGPPPLPPFNGSAASPAFAQGGAAAATTPFAPLNHAGYSLWESVAISLVLTAIILVTAVGNLLVCVCVALVRRLRRPCNYLLVSLAVSDLCVAALVMPPALIYEVQGRWPFGHVACNLWVSFDVLSCTASILNLCMISVDRYFAITKPLEYGVKRTPRRMVTWIVLVWCFAACISLPPLLIIGNVHEEREEDGHVIEEVCLVSQDFAYQLYATMCSFYIPLAVMIVVYYKIFRAARRIVLEEKRAQSHLEAATAVGRVGVGVGTAGHGHCYLEISVRNGGGPESKLKASPAHHRHHHHRHRHSTASTNTTCSLEKGSAGGGNGNGNSGGSALARCFAARASSESQCPMLGGRLGRFGRKRAASSPRAGAGATAQAPAAHAHSRRLRFQLAKERKASTTLGIIMSAFIVCWLPFFVLALVRPFLQETSNALKTLGSLFLWLGYANSLLNPVIYATLNRDFRKPFQAILYFRCGSLNHMMREDFYHSQYGDPEQVPSGGRGGAGVGAGGHRDADDGVEYIEADGDAVKVHDADAARESFL